MKKTVFASTRKSSGKSSIIAGLMNTMEGGFAYLKPFGDRLIYRWKKSWDYDSSVITDIFNLTAEPENITIGFNHSKLRYMYDADSLGEKIRGMVEAAGEGADCLFIEGGEDLMYGASLGLDSISIARYAGARLVLVAGGDDDRVLDDIYFASRYLRTGDVDFAGVIINKADDVDEFENSNMKALKDLGVNVLGILPFKEQLTHFTVKYIADKFFAKVIAGDAGLNRIIRNVFVGAMSADESLRNPLFNKEGRFLITSGDRSDMIIAALESETVGIMLTNNLLPPRHIISAAEEKNIPLLLVTADTYEASKQIDRMEALLTADDFNRLALLGQMINKYAGAGKFIR